MTHDNIRFVAHIDILGMSKIVEKDPEQAWSMLSELVTVKDRVGGFTLEFLDTDQIVPVSEVTRAVTFSDTIILFTKSISDTELRSLIITVTEILHKAMVRCVPVRIGLSMGTFFFNIDHSMYAGPALIDAYRIGESSQWVGISLAKSMQDRARGLKMKTEGSAVIVEWPVPIKGGTEQRLVVNWPAVFAHDLKVKPPITVLQFYQAFENFFGPFATLSPDVQAKYENTVIFMNRQLELLSSSS